MPTLLGCLPNQSVAMAHVVRNAVIVRPPILSAMVRVLVAPIQNVAVCYRRPIQVKCMSLPELETPLLIRSLM